MPYAMFYALIYLFHVMLVFGTTSFLAFYVYCLIYMYYVSPHAYLHACAQIYGSLCLLLCFMPCVPMFYAFFCSRLMLGLHARMLDIMSMVMPCLDLCVLCIYFHTIWLDPCLHMLICLDPCSFMSMCLGSTCLHACF